jgi:hypothetical protein
MYMFAYIYMYSHAYMYIWVNICISIYLHFSHINIHLYTFIHTYFLNHQDESFLHKPTVTDSISVSKNPKYGDENELIPDNETVIFTDKKRKKISVRLPDDQVRLDIYIYIYMYIYIHFYTIYTFIHIDSYTNVNPFRSLTRWLISCQPRQRERS